MPVNEVQGVALNGHVCLPGPGEAPHRAGAQLFHFGDADIIEPGRTSGVEDEEPDVA